MQTNRSLRNVETRGDCECHAKLGDDFLFAPEALLTNARSAFKSSLLPEATFRWTVASGAKRRMMDGTMCKKLYRLIILSVSFT